MKLHVVASALAALVVSSSASAYSVQGGDVMAKVVAGAAVNVVRLDVATRGTPPAAMIIGVDVDYSIDGPWNVTAQFHPGFSPGYITGDLGIGLKYRVVQLQAPIIPYGALLATGALGGPVSYGDAHVNAGLRLAGGVDYFVTRHLALGVEIAAQASELFTPLLQPEISTSFTAGLSWRF